MSGRRVAMVTGAAGGIGGACALRLAADGFLVVAVDLREPAARVAEIEAAGGVGVAEACNLGDAAAVEELAVRALDREGRCDVLVNCAAHLEMRDFDQLDLALWRQVQAVNVEAAFLLSSHLVPAMRERGFGRIVNIVSNTFWSTPGPGMVAYVASKGALVGFTRALSTEIGRDGITVNAVAPGLTPTPATERDMSATDFAAVRDEQSIKRTLAPADIAGAVSYLVSDDAAMVSGQALRVDGGLVTL
jgi:NAD(P)-dependent dehydrogenase (short-subunit alcohol dehydrogenase family)